MQNIYFLHLALDYSHESLNKNLIMMVYHRWISSKKHILLWLFQEITYVGKD